MIRLTPSDRQTAAARIFKDHSPAQITDVISWAEPDIAERLRALVARHTKDD